MLLVFCATLSAQDKAQDRGKFLAPRTTVADDPRRLPIPPGPQGPEGVLVLTGGRIFDSTGAPVHAGTVVIERNRIAKMLPAGSKDWPAGARVIDVAGKTVMPGLIDLHTHIDYSEPGVPRELDISGADAALRGMERLRFYIESGITSIRDVASHGEVPFRLKEWVARNRIPGPRMFVAGQLITGTGGHGSEGLTTVPRDAQSIREASGPDDWREAVREQLKRGADTIKIASHFSKAEVAAAVEEAHALGLKITCDCETFYIEWAVQAGVDGVEHPLPRTDAAIAEMARRGTYADPTLIPYEFIFDQMGGYFYSTSRRFTFSKAENFAVLRRMKVAGIKMGIGTDLVTDWFRTLPYPYIKEMKNFVEAGFTIQETLAVATRTNAEILDMQDKIGTLETGKLADLIVINGRPDLNLDDLAHVDLVVRDGYVLVEGGRVSIPRHTQSAPPKPH
jgi:imidazolonepropionase-like amidohydrolase